jgi:hypothetical protein
MNYQMAAVKGAAAKPAQDPPVVILPEGPAITVPANPSDKTAERANKPGAATIPAGAAKAAGPTIEDRAKTAGAETTAGAAATREPAATSPG